MSGRPAIAIIAAAGLALLAGCADEGADPVSPGGGDVVFYARDIQPLWDRDCTACHGENGEGGLDLRAGLSHANLAATPASGYAANRVEPGDPTASVLYGKLADTGQFGGLMPDGGPALSAADLERVRLWIIGGALDD